MVVIEFSGIASSWFFVYNNKTLSPITISRTFNSYAYNWTYNDVPERVFRVQGLLIYTNNQDGAISEDPITTTWGWSVEAVKSIHHYLADQVVHVICPWLNRAIFVRLSSLFLLSICHSHNRQRMQRYQPNTSMIKSGTFQLNLLWLLYMLSSRKTISWQKTPELMFKALT